MGKSWDATLPDPECWREVFRVLKPGGYLLAFGGTRTFHRLACMLEDVGFEIRDTLCWLFGTGFPKGDGCLKPAWEPILLARKPGKRVLPLGIDRCRVGADTIRTSGAKPGRGSFAGEPDATGSHIWNGREPSEHIGRYPANVLHDGSDAADMLGDAARFFYCAKASKAERGPDNRHPTVKPLALMRWMVRLVTPEGGKVLDPFAGSGTTLAAAAMEGREAFGVELDPAHCEVVRKRETAAMGTGLLAGV